MLVFLFLFQLSVLPALLSSVELNFIFLFVVSISLIYSFHENVYLIMLGGILIDLFSSAGFGIFTISLLCIALIIDTVRQIVLPERRGTLMPFLFFSLSRIVYDGIVYILLCFFAYYRLSSIPPLNPVRNVTQYVLILIASSFIGLLIYKVVDKLERSFGKGRMDLKITNS